MRFHQRVRTIYVKELIDILRDHRTLIAMIVVPIVLYPLLMLGSVQAVSFQSARIEEEVMQVAVLNANQARTLYELVRVDRIALAQEAAQPVSQSDKEPPSPIQEDKIDIRPAYSLDQIDRAIRERRAHVGVVFERDELVNDPAVQNKITWRHDKEDVRSTAAKNRLEDVIQRVARRTVEARKLNSRLPAAFDQPFLMESVDLSAPPSILGQILPLILVLMTITGAIYPAIDLTAGERERGTLESLMVCPAPVIDLIVGKFLVVTTVALMGAALNLASVTATVYFGGFGQIIATTGGSMPLGTMFFILLALIPFAVLMSALMIAVCSFARTFKEAQNYVTPVILAVLIPGGIAALPATKLEGVMLAMPVGNMVLLARDMLLGAHIPAWSIFMVIFSTTLYAGAAVAIAAGVFGRESVVFSDSASFKGMFRRKLLKPRNLPSISTALLLVSLLFPLWFFLQSYLSPKQDEDARGLLYATAWLMPGVFVFIPVLLLAYLKTDLIETFAFRIPRAKYFLAALLIGLSAWAVAHEVSMLQQELLGTPEAVLRSNELLLKTMNNMPLLHILLLLAFIPAICEELLFRGFLISGLVGAMGKWGSILLSAAIFGIFHFFLFRFTVTAGLGIVLGYLCWQSRSVIPGMLAHSLHNCIVAIIAVRADSMKFAQSAGDSGHLSPVPLALAVLVFVTGLAICAWGRRRTSQLQLDASLAPHRGLMQVDATGAEGAL